MDIMCHRKGITLVETLVVLAIVSIVMALFLSGVQKVRASAARIACLSNARNIALATIANGDLHGGLPPGVNHRFIPLTSSGFRLRDGGQAWLTIILPQLEHRAIFNAADEAYRLEFHGFPHSHEHISRTVIPTYLCPSDPRTHIEVEGKSSATTCFLGNIGTSKDETNGPLQFDRRTPMLQITDGTSQTILFGERPSGHFGTWFTGWGMNLAYFGQVMHIGHPDSVPFWASNCQVSDEPFRWGTPDGCHEYHYYSMHHGGGVFGFTDGSCRFLTYSSTPKAIFRAMITRNGSEVVE